MIRICGPNGYIFFDCFMAESGDLSTLQRWIDCKHTHPVVLPEKLMNDFFAARGSKQVHAFTAPLGCDVSKYVVFKKVL